MSKKLKKDLNQQTASLVAAVTGGPVEDRYYEELMERIEARKKVAPKPSKPKKKNAAAVALGRLGGLKGGRARAEKLTPERLREIAQKAAEARWAAAAADKTPYKGPPMPAEIVLKPELMNWEQKISSQDLEKKSVPRGKTRPSEKSPPRTIRSVTPKAEKATK